MKNSAFRCILVIAVLFYFSNVKAQERTITGIVTTFDSIPLINAQLKVKSTKLIVFTDTLGKFQLQCSPIDNIKVSAEGFYWQKVKLDEKVKVLLVNLKLKDIPKSREIDVGYGHIKEKDKLFAISSFTEKNVDFSMFSNMYDLLKGKLPGVQIINNEFIIRGNRSINYGNAALIVVDGMVVEKDFLSSLSPNEVKSIDVLKDGASSIYGSRGANGVIIIQTKRGSDD